MTGIEAIEKFVSDVHTLKVLMFALYGWAFCATVFIAILFVRGRQIENEVTISAFANRYGITKQALSRWVIEHAEKKEGPSNMPNERK